MKRFFHESLLVVIVTLVMTLTGCGSSRDNGFINTDVYENEEFWKGNEIATVTNVSLVKDEVEDNIESQRFSELSKEQAKKVKKLRKAISKFFEKRYGIDFSEKLEKQKVTFFSASTIGDSIALGYVDINDSDILHLNVLLNADKQELFEQTYVHESLHQLGFNDKECKMTYLIEGIVDAYTDLILTENGFKSQPTELYFETRQLGYQIIAADSNLPNVFLKQQSLKEYIDKSLDLYQQKYVKHDDLAVYLNTVLEALIAINSGTGYSENAYYYAFDAQSIVQKFCQAQGCTEKTISYIRSHYLLEDFERLKVIDHGEETYSIY